MKTVDSVRKIVGGNWSTLSAQPVRWMRKEVCVYSIHVCGRIQERETETPVTELASSSCIQQDSELLIFMSTHLYNKHTMFVKSLVGQTSFPPPSFPASYYSLLPVPPSRDHSHFPSHWVTYTHFLLFFFFFSLIDVAHVSVWLSAMCCGCRPRGCKLDWLEEYFSRSQSGACAGFL